MHHPQSYTIQFSKINAPIIFHQCITLFYQWCHPLNIPVPISAPLHNFSIKYVNFSHSICIHNFPPVHHPSLTTGVILQTPRSNLIRYVQFPYLICTHDFPLVHHSFWPMIPPINYICINFHIRVQILHSICTHNFPPVYPSFWPMVSPYL